METARNPASDGICPRVSQSGAWGVEVRTVNARLASIETTAKEAFFMARHPDNFKAIHRGARGLWSILPKKEMGESQIMPCKGRPGAASASTRFVIAGSSISGGAWWGLIR